MVQLIEQISLKDITRREVGLYEAISEQDTFYAIFDDVQQRYCVSIIPGNASDRPAWVVVMAQVVGDKVVILEDATDKPLVDALMVNGGIPREQIILAYKGETLPE